MLEQIKLLLGEAAASYTDAEIELALKMAQQEAAAYCGRTLDEELLYVSQKMAIVMLNRKNTEGLNGQSYNGVNETYMNGYPADIMNILNRKRKVKFV